MFNVSIIYCYNYTCFATNKSLHKIINAFNVKIFQERYKKYVQKIYIILVATYAYAIEP